MMPDVLVVLPIVKELKVLPSTKLLLRVSAGLNELASEKICNAPVVLTVRGLPRVSASPCTHTLLLDEVTKLDALAPTNTPSSYQLVTFKPLA